MKILVVHKSSTLEHYTKESPRVPFSKLIRAKHKSVDDLCQAHCEHVSGLEQVISALKKAGLSYRAVHRDHLKKITEDLVITVGGDGTLLRASHFVGNQPILGINSSPSMSVGALCTVTANQFDSALVLGALVKNVNPTSALSHYRTIELARLEVLVNKKPLPVLATNDVLFTNKSPAGTTHYKIEFAGKKEDQRSSGIWVATPCGSTAAISAAGGKKLPYTSQDLQFVVRELFLHPKTKPKIFSGIFKKDHSLAITNKTMEAALFIDGTQDVFPLQFGDEITFRPAKNSLRVVSKL